MLKLSDRSTPTCFVVDAEGAISGDEYDDFADAFEDAVEKYKTVNLVLNLLDTVKYGDKDAFEEDWEFFTEKYKHARRVAIVGGGSLVRGAMRVTAPFTRAEEKFFEAGELDAAIDWACAEA